MQMESRERVQGFINVGVFVEFLCVSSFRQLCSQEVLINCLFIKPDKALRCVQVEVAPAKHSASVLVSQQHKTQHGSVSPGAPLRAAVLLCCCAAVLLCARHEGNFSVSVLPSLLFPHLSTLFLPKSLM